VNAYEVKAGIGVIAGKSARSIHERLECDYKKSAIYSYVYVNIWSFYHRRVATPFSTILVFR